MPGSLLVSLRFVGGLAELSASTLRASLTGVLSHETTNAGIARWAAGVVKDARIDLLVEGRANLAPGESFVLMSNHQSHLDIPVLFHALAPNIRMVTKKELFAFPVFGRAMRVAGFVEVDRADRGRAIESLKAAASVMSQSLHIWIAPEGTRSRTGELRPFKKGGFMLALDAHARILPMALWGTRDVLPPDTALSRKGQRVAVVVGEPVPTEGKARDALMAEVRAAMEQLLDRAKALASRPR
jgi:1-acyl-sn-glycerol-3-phosphate acyltransferase